MLQSYLPSENTVSESALYEYPALLREQVIKAPQAPGVYTFTGVNHNFPLYIGKSINIRSRLLSHLRNPNETRLLQQTKSITYIPTAGEVSALLLEAQMIKEQKPLFNKRLRKTKDACSFVISGDNLRIQYMDKLGEISSAELFGIFKNPTAAKARLREIADEHQLCLSVLGFEPYAKGKPCFRSAIKKCAGACCGRENIEQHNERLRLALHHYKVAAWPYAGAIALYESFDNIKQYHVLNNWHYHGSYTSERSLKNYKMNKNTFFDADMYRILVKPILLDKVAVIDLKNSENM